MNAERIKCWCEIRTALLEVINIQSHEYDPVDLQKVQDTLNQVYDRFVAKYGAINSKGNILAFSDDDQFPLLRSIEDERKDKTGWDDFNTDLVEMRKGRSVEDLDRQRMAELETAFEQSAEEEPEQGMEV